MAVELRRDWRSKSSSRRCVRRATSSSTREVKHATGQLEDTAKLRRVRRDIARVETVLLREARGDEVSERGNRRSLIGTVVSDKMDKTVVVRVERLVQDSRYKKYIRRYSRFMAHDENNDCKTGDRVRIIEHRPLSKRKRWKVQETVVQGDRSSRSGERMNGEMIQA